MFSQVNQGTLPGTARRAEGEHGGLGEDPGSTTTYLEAAERLGSYNASTEASAGPLEYYL